MKKDSTKRFVYIAMYSAMVLVLDLITNTFNLFRMPQGGSLSLASIGILMAGYHLKAKDGVMVAIVSVILMAVTGSVSYYGLASLLLDYVLGYVAYGLACIIRGYYGIVAANLARLLFSTLSGVIVWQTDFLASVSYNASYIVPTLILDIIVVPLLMIKLKPAMEK